MANDFDPEDKSSWYFGPLSRDESNEIFNNVTENGVFLVRDSQSIRGDFVLCVKEDNKISHYIINKIQVGQSLQFRIGDQQFPDIPSLLSFYKTHYLDTTALIRPAPREKVITKYPFDGRDPEDLPFRKGEILEVISKDEEKWWTARNSEGRTGSIPVPYIQRYEERPQIEDDQFPPVPPTPVQVTHPVQQQIHVTPTKLPCKAVVVTPRVPNLYDKTQLRLEKDDIVTVLKMNKNGQWEGEIDSRKGLFPFTHVKLLPDEEVNSNT